MSRIKPLKKDEILESAVAALDFENQRVINQRLAIDTACLKCGKKRTYAVSEIRHRRAIFTGLCNKCQGRKASGQRRKYLTGKDIPDEIKPYVDLSRQEAVDHALCVWVTCPGCAESRWLAASTFRIPGRSVTCRCKKCHDQHLKSGLNGKGYEHVYIRKDDPRRIWLAPMLHRDKIIPVHRLIIAEQLGRPLEPWEHVHHIDGNRRNNDPDNLKLVLERTHSAISMMTRETNKLKKEIEILRAELGKYKSAFGEMK